MGSWSVSCGISNIAITSGHDCVLLPLKSDNSSETSNYCPATLPIFGKYNDYGGIEDIIEDDNTKFIEEHFGVSIDEFCEFLVDGKFTYDRDEAKAIAKKLDKNNTLEEIEKWRFMWIDKQVFDVMVKNYSKWEKGHMDFGTPTILKALGFEFVEKRDDFENYDPKRFSQKWKKGDVEVYSDGKTMLSLTGQYVWHIGHNTPNSVEHYVETPEELDYLKELTGAQAWRFMEDRRRNELGYILGDRYGSYELEDMIAKLKGTPVVLKTLKQKYFANMETFGDRLVQLITIRHNMHSMSGSYSPHVLYLTPQCGEHRQHQILLEAFAKINKTYVDEYDDDDDDE